MGYDEYKIGHYELRRELGRGAMAKVWLAWDSNLQREVAIKEPLIDPNVTMEMREEVGRLFVKEGRAAARLIHPGIVTVFDADVYDGRPAIIMEYIEGYTLAKVIEGGPLSAQDTLSALDQLLDAVGYAHDKGVVHRDIKPDNIFITKTGRVKLADFGVAHIDNKTYATIAGSVLGTPGYMSPEQARGLTVDGRSDLFSVGVVAYEMLTGNNPFGAGNTTALLYRIVHEDVPELPESVSEGLPADMRPAIMAALQKDPDKRPQTAQEFKRMLHGNRMATTIHRQRVANYQEPETLILKPRTPRSSLIPFAVVGGIAIVFFAIMFMSANSFSGGGNYSSNVHMPKDENASTATVEIADNTAEQQHASTTDSDDGNANAANIDSTSATSSDSRKNSPDGKSASNTDGNNETAKKETESPQKKSSITDPAKLYPAVDSNISTLVNGGHMCYGDETEIYYAVPERGSYWDTKQIVAADKYGSGARLVYSAPNETQNLYHISVVDSYLVFNQVIEHNSSVIVADRYSKNSYRTLDSCDDWSLCQVDNGWVYYQKGNIICRCDIEGNDRKSLMKIANNTYWRIYDNKVFTFSTDKGRDIYISDLDGKNKTKVYSSSGDRIISNAYPVESGKILVLETAADGTDGAIYYIDVAHGDVKTLITGRNLLRMCNDSNLVYYTVKVKDDVYRVGAVDFDGRSQGPEREINDGGEVRYTNVMQDIDVIFYGVITTDHENIIRGMDAQYGSPWTIDFN